MFLCVMLLFLYVILNLIYARNICWKRNQKKKRQPCMRSYYTIRADRERPLLLAHYFEYPTRQAVKKRASNSVRIKWRHSSIFENIIHPFVKNIVDR